MTLNDRPFLVAADKATSSENAPLVLSSRINPSKYPKFDPADCLWTLDELVNNSPFKHLPQDKNIPIVLGNCPRNMVRILANFEKSPAFLAGVHLSWAL